MSIGDGKVCSHVLGELSEELLQILGELKYLRSLRLVTRGITHSYNNIFSGILGNMPAPDGTLSCRNPDVLSDLVQRAINETEILFGFSRPSKENGTVQSFLGIVERAVWALRSISPKHSIAIHCQSPHLKVRGCSSDLLLLLFYLGENGISAMPDGGEVSFEITTNTSDAGSPLIIVKVQDEGAGVDRVITDTLFLPFVSTWRKTNDGGLGLYFARRIAEAHGGTLDLDYSGDNRAGASFVIKLPGILPTVSDTSIPVSDSGLMSEKTKHVFFVIDDDSTLLDYLVEGLQRKGHIVFSASNCAEAIEEYDNVKNIVTLFLVDIGLTDIDGVSCMSELQSLYGLSSVIFMSGEQDDKRSEQIPGAVFLPKPFTINQLEDLAAHVTALR